MSIINSTILSAIIICQYLFIHHIDLLKYIIVFIIMIINSYYKDVCHDHFLFTS